MNKSKLPMKIENKSIVDISKKIGYKTARILGGVISTVGMASLFGLSLTTVPVLSIPAFIASVYSAQYLLNNTMYKSYKDLAFVTGKHDGNVKIYQDITRIDMIRKILNLSNIDKAAFMQLNIIAGMTKVSNVDNKGNDVIYETDTHGINRKTFKKLEELGYLKDYEEKLWKKSRIILPKLAFGNLKDLNKKVDIYNIKFKLTEKKIDINDTKLQKSFPMIFGRKGIISNQGYNLITETDGSLTIDYNAKELYKKQVSLQQNSRQKLYNELRRGVPSLEEQKKYAQQILSSKKEKRVEDRNLDR